MKKVFWGIALLTMLLVTACISNPPVSPPPVNHIKFMGIPLDGTIDIFQKKLATKGISLDKKTNDTMPIGVRAYKGVFATYNASIYIYFDKNTNIVFKAKTCIKHISQKYYERDYQELKEFLSAKYGDPQQEPNGLKALVFYVEGGRIDLYTRDNDILVPIEHVIHIDYNDSINYIGHIGSVLNDL